MKDTFKHRVAQVLSGEYRPDDIVPVCSTPDLARAVGFDDANIVMTQKHIRNCLAPEDASRGEHNHDLPIDFMDELPSYIESPAMILASMTQPDSIVLVTDRKDKRDRPIIVALKNAGTGTVGGKVISCNIVTSAYGRNGFSEFLNNSLKNNGLLYLDIKKSRDLVVSAGLQLPGLLANLDSMTIIRRYNENVNTFKQKSLKNSKNFMPEQFGQTLKGADGLPVAYADGEGRQKLYEYGRNADGSSLLSKTTITFSDGRQETTEYGDGGRIVRMQRFDVAGRKTYSYFSDGTGRNREESTEYIENSISASRSIHEKSREPTEYNTTKESWREYDERDNITSSKLNVRDKIGKTLHSSEVHFGYDNYGNVISEASSDGSISKYEYYSPSLVRDYFGYTADSYSKGVIDHDRIKRETTQYADGNICVKSYSLDGKFTQAKYSESGKLTEFIAENGEIFRDTAAERAMLKSSGQATNKEPAVNSKQKSRTQSQEHAQSASKPQQQKTASNSKTEAQKMVVTKTVTKTVTTPKPGGKSGGRSGAGR